MLAIILAFFTLTDTTQFEKITITRDFISEGVAVADVNRDGYWDILAGAFWFEAPNWKRHEIDVPLKRDPFKEYINSFLNYSTDVDHDGYPDMIRVGLPGEELVWYRNPGKGIEKHWQKFQLLDHFGNESPMFVDINGDDAKDIVGNDPVAKEVIWFEAPTKKGVTTWIRHVIARGDIGTDRYTHGLGHIDMNGDGLRDVVITKGWWECPTDARREDWTFHSLDLGADCAQMLSPDPCCNSAENIFTSSAHDYGVWLYHRNDKNPSSDWDKVLINEMVSETHALEMADLNADDRIDLVTGKRWYAHNGGDRGGNDPAVLLWLEGMPDGRWKSHIIDEDSGVGLQARVWDMNQDKRPDIVVCNKKGLFVFLQETNKHR